MSAGHSAKYTNIYTQDLNDLKFQVKNLEIMNDDPSEVDVIYGQIHCDKLQMIAETIVNQFVDTGLMPRQFDRVKLHITLLNSIFRKNDDDYCDETDKSIKRETMDARPILKQFGDYVFANVKMKEIHLSQRRAGKRSKENYYFPSTIVTL